jgi:HEAT repeat protein
MSVFFLMVLCATVAEAQAQPQGQAEPEGRAQSEALSNASATDPAQIARNLLEDAIQDKNPDVRKHDAEAMSLMKTDDKIFHDLESMLNDRDVLVRIAVVTTLGGFKDEKAVPPLAKALRDPTPEVDFAAAKALFQMHDPKGKEFLLDVVSKQSKATSSYFTKQERDAQRLLHTPDKLFTTAAIGAVGLVPVPGVGLGVSSAQGILTDNDSSARAAALLLLGHETDSTTAAEVHDALTDKEWSVRAAAVHVIATHPYRGFRQDLVPLLDDKKDAVRLRAAAAYLVLEGPPKQQPAPKHAAKENHR